MLVICLLFYNTTSAQMPPMMPGGGLGNLNNPNNPFGTDSIPMDSTRKNKKWTNPKAKIYYTIGNSEVKQQMDSSITTLHRRFNASYPWIHYLGNYGTATRNIAFESPKHLGPTLGYTAYHPYRFQLEDIAYYNTTRPYSQFEYSMGSKTEQTVSILHTQNVNNQFNFAIQVKNANSPGFYLNQLSIYNGGFASLNYLSPKQRWKAKLGIIINNNRSDENGGLANIADLEDTRYIDRIQIPTNIQRAPGSARRSMITNNHRNLALILENNYRWGIADTLYNEDSTAITPRFTPTWGLKHQLLYANEKHRYTDKSPNQDRYAFLDALPTFVNGDSVYQNQIHNKIENKFSINGYIGKVGKQLSVEAGAANRIDIIKDDIPNNDYQTTLVNNYVFGSLLKEALDSNQWSYGANVQFYFAGSAIGDFTVNGLLSKSFKNIGALELGIRQSLSCPYLNFERFATNHYTVTNDLNKTSSTQLSASIFIDKIQLKLSAKNHLVGNYLYYNDAFKVEQSSEVFNVTQFAAHHNIRIGNMRFITEGIVQQSTNNAPINIPLVALRHITAYERYLFNNKFLGTVGIDVSYNTPFEVAGYTPYFNQYFFQEGIKISNPPMVSVFFTFKVSDLSLFIAGEQLQQLVIKKNIINAPNYPMQNALFRMGFKWILYN